MTMPTIGLTSLPRAAIYARRSQSQDGPDDETKSVVRQVANARTFAAAKGLAAASRTRSDWR
jgi:hypothetical protein